MMQISCQFDGGSIEVVDSTDSFNVQLKLRPDSHADFRQWFYFRVLHQAGSACHFTIRNAGAAFGPDWHGYHPCISYDRINWQRVAATFDGSCLQFGLTPEFDSFYISYFPPYSQDRHADLVHQAAQSELAQLTSLGTTVCGRDIDLLQVGHQQHGKPVIWIIARQHPGETMAEWFIEGLLGRLLDSQDPVASVLRSQAVFYIVPNMNPDGSYLGNIRTNARGVNLNRAWSDPDVVTCPEVYHVRNKMHATGVDAFLDIHGDEQIPYTFLAGCEGVPSFNSKMAQLQDLFKAQLLAQTPDFQTVHGYDKDSIEAADLSIATHYIAETFNCLAYTVEMPFKDHLYNPDQLNGWSISRCQHLAGAVMVALYQVLPQLGSKAEDQSDKQWSGPDISRRCSMS